MKSVGKGLVCVVLLVLAGFCFSRFRVEYNRPDPRSARIAESEPAAEAPAAEPTDPTAGTNTVSETNLAAVSATTTNAAAAVGSVVGPTNASPAAPAKAKAKASAARGAASSTVMYLAGFVVSLLGLAVLLGWEVTQWAASRVTRGIGADPLPAEADPLYEAAEAEWSKGNHLDAITMMRDYLKRNPSQQHVAIRIAEIYEKDLNNYLAAALELEDVLGGRLPREKWGWTAIHLANLYSGRLNQSDKAIATLERLASEYPDTAAAKKARQRLGIPEPTEAPVGEMAADDLPPPPPEDPGNLPQGFRSKKK